MPTPRSRLAALVCAAVLGASACSSSAASSPAVSVNGDTITEEAVEEELANIQSNERYRQSVEQGLAQQGLEMTVSGSGEGTFDSAFVARLLSLNVYYRLLEQELEERGLEVTEDDLDAIRPQAVNAVGGQDVFDAFPEDYRQALVRRQALTRELQQALGAGVGMEDARKLFEENQDDFFGVCVSHIFASAQQRGLDGAEARINELAAQLEAGADFRQLATEESDDTAAAAQGGSLDCGGRGRFLPEFEEVAFELPVGEVSDPVQSSVGYHLILVEERRPLTFEEVQPQVEQELQRRQLTAFSELIDELTCEADVEVNPRYGSWMDGCDDPAIVGEVVPPEGPAASGAPAGNVPPPPSG
ncbi:MAG: peptidylprolyl isomerase [Actinobacteria bacterium]|nr:peptidylprolyl isomerase [Actinomycetota bacterium]